MSEPAPAVARKPSAELRPPSAAEVLQAVLRRLVPFAKAVEPTSVTLEEGGILLTLTVAKSPGATSEEVTSD